jgi:hypothetical protein
MNMTDQDDLVEIIDEDDFELWLRNGGFNGEPFTVGADSAEVEGDGVLLQVEVKCRYVASRQTFAAKATAQTTNTSKTEPAAVRNLRVVLQLGNQRFPARLNPHGGMVSTGIVAITIRKGKGPRPAKAHANCEIPHLEVETKTLFTPES